MDSTHRRISEQDAQADHLEKMLEVAKCIIDRPASCLPELLLHWSFEVRSQHSIDAISPTRKELAEASAEFRKLASPLWEH
jgi:hypothetical protein